ncbi:hypothetical protein BJ508DRAFT_315885 [Ascobolus immersus RN42]|uniref:Uncharacterized protein n=1 Tax=Ascobolus immersus RN42 TaxID=1160509 RepID=A0A3N4H8S2_ASCIM|nr:hypothetical protein BJ508DRAFT_315885 [Ascobolus immersus RN42]
MHSPNAFQQQPIFVTIPEYQPTDFYLQQNPSLTSLLASETSSIGSPTSVSEFDLYTDDFYNMAASPVYSTYPTDFSDQWSQTQGYAPSSPSGSIQYFPEPTAYPTAAPSPAKRARKAAPEPCNCMYCLPTSAPTSAQAPAQHMHNGVPRKNVQGGGVIGAAPQLQLQFQIDTAPRPIIVGQHGLGADAAYLRQNENVQREQSIFDGEQHFYAHGY